MDTLGVANWANDMFPLFQNIPVFGEHLYFPEVFTAIASFSDLKFLFQQKLCEVLLQMVSPNSRNRVQLKKPQVFPSRIIKLLSRLLFPF